MEITWFGHSCFRLTERGGAVVVTDPFDSSLVGYQPLKLKADIVTISHDSPSHNYLAGVKGDYRVLRGPGEYEIADVFITGASTAPHTKDVAAKEQNTIYLFDFNGVNIVHLGDINRIPTQTEIDALGPIHIALTPVGGEGGLNAAQAVEIINLLEPNIVIPMHYATPASKLKLETLDRFLKVMGVQKVENPVPSLKINTIDLNDEIRVVVLDYQRAERG